MSPFIRSGGFEDEFGIVFTWCPSKTDGDSKKNRATQKLFVNSIHAVKTYRRSAFPIFE